MDPLATTFGRERPSRWHRPPKGHIVPLLTRPQKLHRAIKKLRKKEVDWDSEDDINSPYIMEDRYKKKFVKVWWKLCELQGRRPLTGREDEKKFRYSGEHSLAKPPHPCVRASSSKK